MNSTKLYISPHFDDAIFSCSGGIIKAIQDGYKIVIVTVFPLGNDHSRFIENSNALSILGVKEVNLGFSDAPFRHEFYNSFKRLILERHILDSTSLLEKIAHSLERIISEIQPIEIYAPLGVGTHIDHRLCFEVAKNYLDKNIIFYEDRPYCLAQYSTEVRLKTLGVSCEALQINYEDYLNEFLNMKYVKEYLSTGNDRDECLKIISTKVLQNYSKTLTAQATIHSFQDNTVNEIWNVISLYESQVRSFYSTREHFFAQSKLYSENLSQKAQYAERYWSFTALTIPEEVVFIR
jgi:hypothetical protein